MKYKFDWVPLRRVGPFKFNDNINKYLDFDLFEIEDEYDQDVNWKVYGLLGCDFRLYVENNIIDSIGCFEECIYNDQNLIGIPFNELTLILKKKPDEKSFEETDKGNFEVFEFDDFSAQVWVKDGVVDSIIISGVYEEE